MTKLTNIPERALPPNGVAFRDAIDFDRFDLTPEDGDIYWQALRVQAPGPSKRMASGAEWFLLAPDPKRVKVYDVAVSLARVNRYGGAFTAPYYSVAQHAVLVALQVWYRTRGDAHAAFWGLHHDDEEAFVGDVISPQKKLPDMDFVRWLGRIHQRAVCIALDMPLEEPAVVKKADRELRALEKVALQPPLEEPLRGTHHDDETAPGNMCLSTSESVSPIDLPQSLVHPTRMLDQWSELVLASGSPPPFHCWNPNQAAVAYMALHRELNEARKPPEYESLHRGPQRFAFDHLFEEPAPSTKTVQPDSTPRLDFEHIPLPTKQMRRWLRRGQQQRPSSWDRWYNEMPSALRAMLDRTAASDEGTTAPEET